MKKLLKKPSFWIVSIEIMVAIILGFFGFKITYNPDLDNNWEAISACATLGGVLVSGVAIYYAIKVPKTIADRQDKIALFEKRFECYMVIQRIISFAESIENVKNPQDIKKKFLSTIIYTNRGIKDFEYVDMVLCFNDLAQVALTGNFLFHNYNYDILKTLIVEITKLVHVFTDKKIQVAEISEEGFEQIQKIFNLSQNFKENYLDSLEEEIILKN